MTTELIRKVWQSPKIQRIDIKRTLVATTGSFVDYLAKPTTFAP